MVAPPYTLRHVEDGVTQERHRLTLDAMLNIEETYEWSSGSESSILNFYGYWLARKDGPIHPGNVPTTHAKTDRGLASWIDVSHGDPWKFVLRNHHGLTFPNCSEKPIGSVPLESHARFCAYEYYECREEAGPVAYYIKQEINGDVREYYRLACPGVERASGRPAVFYEIRAVKLQSIKPYNPERSAPRIDPYSCT